MICTSNVFFISNPDPNPDPNLDPNPDPKLRSKPDLNLDQNWKKIVLNPQHCLYIYHRIPYIFRNLSPVHLPITRTYPTNHHQQSVSFTTAAAWFIFNMLFIIYKYMSLDFLS
jgi:hypothetical protein